jgi:hypothetical protein
MEIVNAWFAKNQRGLNNMKMAFTKFVETMEKHHSIYPFTKAVDRLLQFIFILS